MRIGDGLASIDCKAHVRSIHALLKGERITPWIKHKVLPDMSDGCSKNRKRQNGKDCAGEKRVHFEMRVNGNEDQSESRI